ncbi:MAG: hypothetical protein PHO92_00770 [Candidatus Peribacteraceae bacterium]|nr:hypothetical protein [Candidatus Peribacteraceae bacterium]
MDAALVKETLGSLLTHLNLPFDSIDLSDGDGFTRVEIRSASASRIIGWHGETLNSIQHLLKSIIRTKEQSEKGPFLVLDIDGYRRDQEEKVCKAAERKADFVRRTGNRVALPPMSPYFRRIVHLHVANTPELQDLTTASTGEGEYRQIVLQMKEKRSGQDQSGELSPVISEKEDDDGLENLDI